jgi:DNA-binding response OmpR family regulator
MVGANILLVEDEENLRKLIRAYFIKEGANVLEGGDGAEGIRIWEENKIDLIVLDIMLPKYDGWALCKKIREESSIPIIMLTARSEESDKLFGFELGADDYITKPFSLKELVARVKALLKRSNQTISQDVLEIQDLIVDKKSHQVYLRNNTLELSPKEYDLLIYLINNKNQALTRQMILDGVWGYDYYGDLRTVDTHIKGYARN